MALTLITAPTVEPITLAEAKNHLKVDTDVKDDDDLINALIVAAREHIEKFTRRVLITQTWNLVLDSFPPGIDPFFSVHSFDVLKREIIIIPNPLLQSIVSVKFIDTDGNTQTFANTKYVVDTDSIPGRIAPTVNEVWPIDVQHVLNAVTIQFKAGYGDAATDVPSAIKISNRLIIGHWYENREMVSEKTLKVVPESVDAILFPYRTMEVE